MYANLGWQLWLLQHFVDVLCISDISSTTGVCMCMVWQELSCVYPNIISHVSCPENTTFWGPVSRASFYFILKQSVWCMAAVVHHVTISTGYQVQRCLVFVYLMHWQYIQYWQIQSVTNVNNIHVEQNICTSTVFTNLLE